MRIIKPQQLSLLSRPFEYRGGCYLGVSVIAALRLTDPGRLLSEVEMWEQAMPALGDQGILDVAMPKRRGEFLAAGRAYAPNGEPAGSMRAGIQVGELSKELWVFGDRFMQDGRISEPEAFASMPMTWENAFGGEGFKPNPMGKGYRATVNARGEKRHWLPNIEHPDRLYRLKGQKPDPAGFGAVDITWPQRMGLAGTYDDHWLKTAFPGFAKDIQWEYFNMASPDQWSKQAFSGDEAFRIYGMHPELPVIEGTLPGIRARCLFLREGSDQLEECACELTTLWFLPEADLLILIHHGSVKIEEDDARDIKSVTIAAEHADRPRDRAHYIEIHDKRADPDGDLFDMVKDEPLMPEGLAESILQPILDQYGDMDQAPLARNMESSLAESVGERRKHAEAAGLDFPEEYVPELADEPLPAIEEIEAFMDEKFDELEKAERQANEKKEALRSQVREQFGDKPEYGPSFEELDPTSAGAGPPKFSADGQRRDLRKQIVSLRDSGGDPSALEAGFDTEEQFATWQSAEREFNDLYRMGAHFQEPVSAADDSQALRERLFRMLDAGQDLDAQDFSGIDLSGVDLSNRNLRGVFMERANLDGATLSGATLDRAVLAHAHLNKTRLDGSSLVEANLGKSRLTDVSARGAVFEESVLFGATIDRCDFSEAHMSGQGLFLDASVIGCRFAGARIEDLFVNERAMADTDFSGATLIDPVFLKADLGGADFSGAVMEEAVFVGCSAAGAVFAGARLAGSVFAEQCLLADCNFNGADLSRVNLRGAVLHRCTFDEAVLSEADLSEVEASGATFCKAAADQSRWVRSDLREADLAGARLIGSVLQKADLRGADLRANLYQSDLARVHVERSTRFENAFTAKMNTYPRKFPKDSDTGG